VGYNASAKNNTKYRITDVEPFRKYKRPEQRAVAAPGIKLRKLKDPVCVIDHPINPPSDTAKAPRYGPNMSPTRGATTVAILMELPGAPITGEKESIERTAYKDAKEQTNAKSFVWNFNCAYHVLLILTKCLLFFIKVCGRVVCGL